MACFIIQISYLSCFVPNLKKKVTFTQNICKKSTVAMRTYAIVISPSLAISKPQAPQMAEIAINTTATRPLKVITGADTFGCTLKDALVSHLRSLNVDVEDLDTSSYYSITVEVGRRVSFANAKSPSSPSSEIRGLGACGTGVGVSIFANKFPGVFATTCLSIADAINTQSINNCNVLAASGLATTPESGIEILDAWLNTPFKAPCPAFGSTPYNEETSSFLDNSLVEMPKIGQEDKKEETSTLNPCALCCLVKNRKLDPIDIIPGGSMKIVRESPTSAFVNGYFKLLT